MEVPERIDELIRAAILQRRKIRFWYGGKERIAEPHDYGVQNGQLRLLAYQVSGQSSSGHLPNWRWIDVSRIEDLEVLEQTFSGNRPTPSSQHHQWDELLLRVSS